MIAYNSTRSGKLSKFLTVVIPFLASLTLQATAVRQAQAASLCSQIFQNSPSSADTAGAQFLHERDPKLHTSVEIERFAKRQSLKTEITLQKPSDKISAWLNRLDGISSKLPNNSGALLKVKEVFHQQYVIKANEVPENYFQLQIRLARERGHGDITFSSAEKMEMAATLIKDQKRSLDNWIDYFVSAEAKVYPTWVKYWMLTGLVKLSKFESESGTFGSRSKETVAPYPELNAEAVSSVVEMILKKLDKKSLKEIQDPKLMQLIDGANFGRLYGHVLKSLGVGQGKFATNEGRWVKYPQGSSPGPLLASLEGRNSGWCTNGEATAKYQLARGDLHVYYSQDKDGKSTLPRIAIKMNGSEIGEIRGVAEYQNLDSQIVKSSVLKDKMQEFGDKGKEFEIKSSHMALLTEIERKVKTGLALTRDEIFFLYEINELVVGFGWSRDPRLDEIISKRDVGSDMALIMQEKNKGILHFNLNGLTSAEKLKIPESFKGTLSLNGLTSAEGLKIPEAFEGVLNLNGLTSAHGLKLPNNFEGYLSLDGITSAEALTLPETFNGTLSLKLLTSGRGMKMPKNFQGTLNIDGLTSADGLLFPDNFNGILNMNGLTSARGMKIPKNFEGVLNISGLTSADGLLFPDNFNVILNMNGLTSPQGLNFPKTMNGYIKLNSLTSAQGAKFPETLHGGLELNGLTTAHGLVPPKAINGSLSLGSLLSKDELKLPEYLTGSLSLDSLKSVHGMIMPKNFDINKYNGPKDF